jgi:thiamine monophosphate kinase
LVVTVKRGLWDEAQKTMERAGGTLYRIGEATKERKMILKTSSGETRNIKPRGYEHFK